jgi:cupin superfamily acireductone dioxygenase involved in methionine salvage
VDENEFHPKITKIDKPVEHFFKFGDPPKTAFLRIFVESPKFVFAGESLSNTTQHFYQRG